MTLDQVIQQGIRADQPAATAVPPGTLYSVTDEAYVLERSDGAVWVQYAPAGGGDVTHTGTLTSGKVLVGNGGADLTVDATTGIAKVASGTLSAATDGTDYLSPSTGVTKLDEATPSGTNTVTFSALGSFTHLRIVWTGRGTQTATATLVGMQFNSDSGANYDEQFIFGSATTPTASQDLGQTAILAAATVSAASAPAGSVGVGTIDIVHYRDTTLYKSGTVLYGYKTSNSSGGLSARTGLFQWRSTAAITSIVLTLASGNFEAGSIFTLYGLP